MSEPNAGEAGTIQRSDEGQKAGGGDDIQAKIDAAVRAAVDPIKANRDEILAEKRELKDKLSSTLSRFEKLGGEEGLESLVKLRERLEADELGKLISEGKHDEWFDKRTQTMRADFENRLNGANEQLAAIQAERDEARAQFMGLKIENEVRAACTASEGFVDSAVRDALRSATSAFTFDAERGVVMKDENGGIVLGKDGATPKTVSDWLEEQKKESRHWWGASQGAGAQGARGGRGAEPSREAIANMSMAEYREYRKQKGMSTGYGGSHVP